jgi:hypothetical protein
MTEVDSNALKFGFKFLQTILDFDIKISLGTV